MPDCYGRAVPDRLVSSMQLQTACMTAGALVLDDSMQDAEEAAVPHLDRQGSGPSVQLAPCSAGLAMVPSGRLSYTLSHGKPSCVQHCPGAGIVEKASMACE